MNGKTLGIIGLGNLGARTAKVGLRVRDEGAGLEPAAHA